jgi:hypothetical protein
MDLAAIWDAIVSWLRAWAPLLIPALAILITVILVPKVYWRNESSLPTTGGQRWRIRLVNRGKGEASNVALQVFVLGARGEKAYLPAETWPLRTRGDVAGLEFPFMPGSDPSKVRARLEWDGHPFPSLRRRRTFRPASQTRPAVGDDDYDVAASVW